MVYQRIHKPSSSNSHSQDKSVPLRPSPLPIQTNPVSRLPHNFANIPVHAPNRPPIQAKLSIGQPNDAYEQEADRVAAHVVQQLHLPVTAQLPDSPSIQRQIQPRPIDRGHSSTSLESGINSARGRGQALDPTLQRSMGRTMGADFSRVRVHTDAQSDQLNRSIQAKAFTTGQDVFFRQGAYDPGSRGGQTLIAHELTHVIQQNSHEMQSPTIIQCQLNEQQLLGTLSKKKGQELRDAILVLLSNLESQGVKANAPNAQRHSPEIFHQLNGLKETLDSLASQETYDLRWSNTFKTTLHEYIDFYNTHEVALQQAEQTNAPRYNLENQVKFGTEFTFTNESIQTISTDDTNSVAMKTAETLISTWAGKIKTHDGKNIVKNSPPTEGNLKPKSTKAIQFIYDLGNNNTWWWALDIDDGCLETQTKPMTYSEASGAVKTIIDTHIFEIATELKLVPHKEIGGGHLTLDATSTLQNNPLTLRNLLVLYHSNFNKWSKYDEDASNAPMMEELSKEVRTKFKEIIDEVDARIAGTKMKGTGKHAKPELPMTEKELVTKLIDLFRTTSAWVEGWNESMNSLKTLKKEDKDKDGNPKDPKLKAAKNVRESPAHYQAINLENMDAEPSKQRFEMRRFAAQKSSEDLLSQMEQILDLIHASKVPVSVPLPNDFISKGRK